MANQQSVGVCGAAGGVSQQEKQEMMKAADFADDHILAMSKMVVEVNAWWNIRLWWDAKVPSNAPFYHLFTLFTSSNSEDIIAEINNYLAFYEAMSSAVKKIYTDEGRSEAEQEHPQEILEKLREKLKAMLKEAKAGKELTSSSTVYRLHREFISQYEKLEVMIKNVQIVSLKHAVGGYLTKIDSLTEEVKKSGVRVNNLRSDVIRVENALADQKMEFRRELVIQRVEQESKQAEQKDEMERKLAGQRVEQERKLAEQKAEMERELAGQRVEQERKLAEQKDEMERKLAGQRAEQERQLIEQKIEQDRKLAEQAQEMGRMLDGRMEVLKREVIEKLLLEKQGIEEEKRRLELENDYLVEIINTKFP